MAPLASAFIYALAATSRVFSRMLQKEISAANNIKDRKNRQMVLMGLRKIDEYLRQLKNIPPTGIVVFQHRRMQHIIRPETPLTVSKYQCNRHFYVQPLLESAKKYPLLEGIAVLIITGDGWKLVQISEGKIHQLDQESANLPPRHRKGGQSAPRFQRKYEEKRIRYVDDALQRSLHHVTYLYAVSRGKRLHELQSRAPKRLVLHVLKTQLKGTLPSVEKVLDDLLPFLRELVVNESQVILQSYVERCKRGDGLITIGKKETAKALRLNNLKRLILGSNVVAPKLRENVERVGAEVLELSAPNPWGSVFGEKYYL